MQPITFEGIIMLWPRRVQSRYTGNPLARRDSAQEEFMMEEDEANELVSARIQSDHCRPSP